MRSYYVTHPNITMDAIVVAPTTEKARTVFLDWLERNNRIKRTDRLVWRRNMVAERLEYPEEVITQTRLYYNRPSESYEDMTRSKVREDIVRPKAVEKQYTCDDVIYEDIPELSTDRRYDSIPVRTPLDRILFGGD